MNEFRADMLKVKRMVTQVELILGKREGETELVNKLIDAQNLLTYCMSRLENAIVPPCKVGDTVYWVDTSIPLKSEMLTGTVFAIGKDENSVIWVSVRYTNGLKFYHTLKDFDKYLYLSREEAEKALKERETE